MKELHGWTLGAASISVRLKVSLLDMLSGHQRGGSGHGPSGEGAATLTPRAVRAQATVLAAPAARVRQGAANRRLWDRARATTWHPTPRSRRSRPLRDGSAPGSPFEPLSLPLFLSSSLPLFLSSSLPLSLSPSLPLSLSPSHLLFLSSSLPLSVILSFWRPAGLAPLRLLLLLLRLLLPELCESILRAGNGLDPVAGTLAVALAGRSGDTATGRVAAALLPLLDEEPILRAGSGLDPDAGTLAVTLAGRSGSGATATGFRGATALLPLPDEELDAEIVWILVPCQAMQGSIRVRKSP